MRHRNAPARGFTLIELLVVVLIIGILAAIAVPQYFKVVEKGKSSEALSTLDSIRGAQERYLAARGNYCRTTLSSCSGFDIAMPTMKYFTLLAAQAGAGTPSWKIRARRNATVAGYGAYIITYDVEPNAKPALTCNNVNCTNDLLPK